MRRLRVDGGAWWRRLLPSQCPLCLAVHPTRPWLCPDCLAALPAVGPACPRCALPSPHGRLCGACLKRPPPQTLTVAALTYAPPVDRLIQDLKFHARLGLAADLGRLLAQAVRARGEALPEALLAVPLHPARLRERGFNQSLELARHCARALGLPLRWGLCRRLRATAVQSTLDRRRRQANLRGAFASAGVPRRVALVDDVMTSGATVAEAVRALLAGGAEEVQVWVAARAALRAG